MSSRIFGPKTVTEIRCQKCIEAGLRTKVLQYEVTYISKRDSYRIITTGVPEELIAAIHKHKAEEDAKCESHAKETRRKKRTRRQTPQAQPRTRRESSPPLPPSPPPPPPTPQPPSKK
ncbi:hypothetical protein Neosp_013345 [[Neocosmospora] mangrovei]